MWSLIDILIRSSLQMNTSGRRYDFCAQGPCYHNGECVQTSQEPGYKCRCAGSGYYGARCEISKKSIRLKGCDVYGYHTIRAPVSYFLINFFEMFDRYQSTRVIWITNPEMRRYLCQNMLSKIWIYTLGILSYKIINIFLWSRFFLLLTQFFNLLLLSTNKEIKHLQNII